MFFSENGIHIFSKYEKEAVHSVKLIVKPSGMVRMDMDKILVCSYKTLNMFLIVYKKKECQVEYRHLGKVEESECISLL